MQYFGWVGTTCVHFGTRLVTSSLPYSMDSSLQEPSFKRVVGGILCMCARGTCMTLHQYDSIYTSVYIRRLCAREFVSISHWYICIRGVRVSVVFRQVHLEMPWWQNSENGETSLGDPAEIEFRHETVNMS